MPKVIQEVSQPNLQSAARLHGHDDAAERPDAPHGDAADDVTPAARRSETLHLPLR